MPHVRPTSDVDIALLLCRLGIVDAEVAAIVDVALRTMQRWRRHYVEQGLPRGQAHTAVPCPRCDDATLDGYAYSHLLGWYLGDGHIVLARRGVYLLSVFSDERYPQLAEAVTQSMRRVKPGGLVHARRKQGCLAISLGWKHWPCLFPQHGPGRKHERAIVLEPWQRRIVQNHPGAFVRGLIHSDGCRVTNRVTKVVGGQPRSYEYRATSSPTPRKTSSRSARGRSTCSGYSTAVPHRATSRSLGATR